MSEDYGKLLEKNCPLCGSPAMIEVYPDRKGFGATIHCDRCLIGLSSITFDTERQAAEDIAKRWNAMRPNEAHNGAITDDDMNIADDAYSTYRSVCKMIESLESIGLRVEGDKSGEGDIGNLFGILEEQMRIISYALGISWIDDDELTNVYETILEDSLDKASDGYRKMPRETLAELLKISSKSAGWDA